MGNIGENMANKRRARKAPALPPEAMSANAAGEARREKEKSARVKNAEKQKRFRDNMKSDGYKRVTLWEYPAPAVQHKRMAGMGFRKVPAWELPQTSTHKSRVAKISVAMRIRETSLNAGAKFPEVQKALTGAASEFLKALGKLPEGNAVYNDFLELIKPLGDPWCEG
jgi:hypothetical protein